MMKHTFLTPTWCMFNVKLVAKLLETFYEQISQIVCPSVVCKHGHKCSA